MIERLRGVDLTNTCTEETLLYQLVSGLHTSINMHVSTNYMEANKNESTPNHEMYYRSIGAYPDRIKNLYFVYAVVLRAINRAEPILRAYEYET
jgi:Endoplasmic Reticulum Oxidoreductin 1 (ERO1)